uniref:Uncharacterized protein n=1 Tax=Setaria italica TaxID=4555 RepID=K3XZE4_SETIT
MPCHAPLRLRPRQDTVFSIKIRGVTDRDRARIRQSIGLRIMGSRRAISTRSIGRSISEVGREIACIRTQLELLTTRLLRTELYSLFYTRDKLCTCSPSGPYLARDHCNLASSSSETLQLRLNRKALAAASPLPAPAHRLGQEAGGATATRIARICPRRDPAAIALDKPTPIGRLCCGSGEIFGRARMPILFGFGASFSPYPCGK